MLSFICLALTIMNIAEDMAVLHVWYFSVNFQNSDAFVMLIRFGSKSDFPQCIDKLTDSNSVLRYQVVIQFFAFSTIFVENSLLGKVCIVFIWCFSVCTQDGHRLGKHWNIREFCWRGNIRETHAKFRNLLKQILIFITIAIIWK